MAIVWEDPAPQPRDEAKEKLRAEAAWFATKCVLGGYAMGVATVYIIQLAK